MSVYHVDRLCHRIQHDPALREALARDPLGTLARWPLTQEERALLLAGDVGRLYEMGCHPFLLGHLTRHETLGVTVERYSDSIRRACDDREPPVEKADWMP